MLQVHDIEPEGIPCQEYGRKVHRTDQRRKAKRNVLYICSDILMRGRTPKKQNIIYMHLIDPSTIVKVKNLQLLKEKADNLWLEGHSSTTFCRLLHNDYQIIFNDELNSPDDFYNLTKEGNKLMIDLLNVLGYDYTTFGICKNNNSYL